MCYKFNKEGSPMWLWKFHLLIDEKPFEALIHSFTREGAYKRLNILVRKGELHGHYIRDVHVVQGEEGLMKNKLAVLSGFMVCYWLSPWRRKRCKKLRCKGNSQNVCVTGWRETKEI